jgi:hypothetical protein
MLVGAVLTVTAILVVLIGAALDLDLKLVALAGIAIGAVVALVPDRSPIMRVSGFVVGFAIAWVAYLVRALMLPDSTGGQAVMMGVTVALAVLVSAVSLGRIPLWAPLLGVGVFSAAYERPFAASIPEAVSTSAATATALLLTTAVGFFATALVAPSGEQPEQRAHRARPPRQDDGETSRLDDMMMEKNS